MRVDLGGVPEALLIALYRRAVESRRPAGQATEILSRVDDDVSRVTLPAHDGLFTIMRVRELDRRAQAFLAAHPKGAGEGA
jgi:O-methyltransferase involved in polyketide biosynthesis